MDVTGEKLREFHGAVYQFIFGPKCVAPVIYVNLVCSLINISSMYAFVDNNVKNRAAHQFVPPLLEVNNTLGPSWMSGVENIVIFSRSWYRETILYLRDCLRVGLKSVAQSLVRFKSAKTIMAKQSLSRL
jgi:hypothetical protein